MFFFSLLLAFTSRNSLVFFYTSTTYIYKTTYNYFFNMRYFIISIVVALFLVANIQAVPTPQGPSGATFSDSQIMAMAAALGLPVQAITPRLSRFGS